MSLFFVFSEVSISFLTWHCCSSGKLNCVRVLFSVCLTSCRVHAHTQTHTHTFVRTLYALARVFRFSVTGHLFLICPVCLFIYSPGYRTDKREHLLYRLILHHGVCVQKLAQFCEASYRGRRGGGKNLKDVHSTSMGH